ncbi:MAG: Protein of unknown function (DUF2585) [Parcubacteria group bacterium Gr01-1014_8]|nr:MAG: Protein of unknown function (DUF2585) [Parcubacteria group bacterium Gr01-1014_8]
MVVMSLRGWILAGFALIGVQALALYFMGQPLISASGMVKLWHGAVLSSDNSQQISDWYTFSHVIHGFLFYLGLWFFFPRMPIAMRFALASGIEVGWELFENTDFIISRYREQALAQGYIGDSVINSICDTLAMVVGFVLAWRLPVSASIAVIIFIEAFMLNWIRDSLTLNIIQLIHPLEGVTNWQSS